MQHFSRRLLLQFCAAIALAIPSAAQFSEIPLPGPEISLPSYPVGAGNTGTDLVDLRLSSDFSSRDKDRVWFPPSFPTTSSGNTDIVAASGSPGPGGCAPDGECEPEHGGHPHHDEQRDNSTCSDSHDPSNQLVRDDCTNSRKDAIVSQSTATTNDDRDSRNYDLWGGIGLLVSLIAFGFVTYLCVR